MRISDWSSDVCSSDLGRRRIRDDPVGVVHQGRPGAALSAPSGNQVRKEGDGSPPVSLFSCTFARRAGGRENGAIHLPRTSPVVKASPSGANGNRQMGVKRDVCAYRSEEHTSELQSLMRISYA